MSPNEELLQTIQATASHDVFPQISNLVNLLTAINDDQLHLDEGRRRITNEVNLASIINSLGTRDFNSSNSIFSIGQGNQTGDVTLRDVVGGNSITLIINQLQERRSNNVDKFARVEHVSLIRTNRDGTVRKYTSELRTPLDLVESALQAIESLSRPESWSNLVITHDLSNSGWMGNKSEYLVDVLYHIYAPIAYFRSRKYLVYRNFSYLDWRIRLRFLLLEAICETITCDMEIAGLSPAIIYSPRVGQWRSKRQVEPQKYWWQGLSQDRLEDALTEFIDAEQGIVAKDTFIQRYDQLFSQGSHQEQQAIGLSANALYGFTPKTRPVFWRILVIQARLYNVILHTTQRSLERPSSVAALQLLLTENKNNEFPYVWEYEESLTFEPFSQTSSASVEYINLLVVPKVNLKLQSAQVR